MPHTQSAKGRIVHVLGSLDRGGAEMRVLAMCRDPLMSESYSHAVLLLGSSVPTEHALTRDFVNAGATVHHSGRNPARVARRLRKLVPSVVHSHVHLSSGWVLLVAALVVPRARRLAHIRSTGSGRPRTFIRGSYERIMRLLLRLISHRIVGVSNAALNGSLGRGWTLWKNTLVVYNGVEPGSIEPRVADGLLRLSVVGRICAEKNQQFAIEVAAAASRTRHVHLAIFGRGDASELERLAARFESESLAIQIHGERPIAQILEQTDVVLAPSLREGLPGVVIEAAAVGVPVVASDIEPMREVAEFLSIACVSLADVGQWASAIVVATPDRARSLERFRQSPFTLDQSHRALLHLWAGEAR